MRFRINGMLPAALVAAMACGQVAAAKVVVLEGNFAAENGTKTAPSGKVYAMLDTVTGALRYKIDYSGLSGAVVAAHFHGPAAPGADAGVLVPIPGPYHSGMGGVAKVTAAEAKDLETGMTYVNLHTKMEPMGEARAQITAK